MKNRLFALILAFLMVFSMVPTSALAEESEEYSWRLSGDTLTINANCVIDAFHAGSYPLWYEARSSITKVIITDGVTTIGNYEFYGLKNVTSVRMPDSVNYIGWSAFEGCSSLTSITIPEGVTSLEDNVFYGCSSLTSVTIPDSVTSISSAFEGCSSLASITIPDSVTSIGFCAFYGCKSLTSITIPDSVTSIGKWAFYGCKSLTSITIPDSVTSIEGAFSGCSSLTSVTIPDSVTSIEEAFAGCSSLTSVTIPDSVTSIGDNAFIGCSGLTNVTIPDSVTSIGDNAFYGCSSLSSVTIPDSVTSIGDNAFKGCSNLTNLTIPDSVISIGDNAFEDCSSLTSIKLPDSVTSFGDYAFYNCSSLTSVTLLENITSFGKHAFDGCSSTLMIYGYSNSYAEMYADENNIGFQSIGSAVKPILPSDTKFVFLTDPDAYVLENSSGTLFTGYEYAGYKDISTVCNIYTVNWSSSNTDVVEIGTTSFTDMSSDTLGKCMWLNNALSYKSAGMSTITGTIGDKSISCDIIVEPKLTMSDDEIDDWTETEGQIEIGSMPYDDSTEETVDKIIDNSTTSISYNTTFESEQIEIESKKEDGLIKIYADIKDVVPGDYIVNFETPAKQGGSLEFTVESTYTFNLSSDIWSFENSDIDFDLPGSESASEYGCYITEADYDRLTSNLSASEKALLCYDGGVLPPLAVKDPSISSTKYALNVDGKLNPHSEWGGSCAGMSMWVCLTKAGVRKATDIYSSKTSLHKYPSNDYSTISALNFYQSIQRTSLLQNKIKEYRAKSFSEKAATLEKYAKQFGINGKTVFVGLNWYKKDSTHSFIKDADGNLEGTGHAIVAYGEEDGIYEISINGEDILTSHRIVTYDPSYLDNVEQSYIYFDDEGNFYIPRYDFAATKKNMSKDIWNNGEISFVTNNLETLNAIDFKTGELSSKESESMSNSTIFQGGLNVNFRVQADGKSAKIENGLTSEDSTLDLYPSISCSDGTVSDSSKYFTAVLPDFKEFTVETEDSDLSYGLKLPNSYVTVYSDEEGCSTINENGTVSINTDEKAENTIIITSDDSETFFSENTITITAKDSSNISVSLDDYGLKVSGDNLSDVTIVCGEDDTAEKVNISTSDTSVIIEETNEGLVQISESDQKITDSGTCGTSANWVLYNDRLLVISGSGNMDDYNSDYTSVPWYKYVDQINSVIIKKGITSIGACAFYQCSALKKITLPEGITKIGSGALDKCTSLKTIYIPSTVNTIMSDAFLRTYSLSSIKVSLKNSTYSSSNGVLFNAAKTKLIKYPSAKANSGYDIPSSVTEISEYAFYKCSNLSSLVMSDSVTRIRSYGICDCENLKNIELSNSLTGFEQYTIANCGIEELNIPDSVKFLSIIAVSGCSNLKSVSIGKGLSGVGYNLFEDCDNLESITVDEENAAFCSVDGVLFNKDKTSLVIYPPAKSGSKYNIPDSVKSIESYAFVHCPNLTKITIPKSVTSICYYAFYVCRNLKNITFEGSAPEISSKAFLSVSATVIYDKTDTSWDNNTLNYGGSLTWNNKSETAESEAYIVDEGSCSSGIKWTFYSDGILKITGSGKLWYVDSGWNDYWNPLKAKYGDIEGIKTILIEDGITEINDNAFAQKDSNYLNTGILTSSPESIIISDTVETIGRYVFYKCEKLKNIHIGKDVKSIGDYSFTYTPALENIDVSADNKYYKSIDGCLYSKDGTILYKVPNKYTEYEVPDGVTTIHYDAIGDDTSLKSITLPESITTIKSEAFSGTSNIETIYYSGSPSEWKKINIEHSNDILQSATIVYAKKDHIHSWSNGTLISKATCSENGSIKYTCSECGKTKLSSIYSISSVKMGYTSVTYSGTVKKPDVTVLNSNGNVINSKYYTVTYASGRKNVGKYKVTVTFKGNYSGTKTQYFTINPKGTSLKSLTAYTKAFTVKWTKQSIQTSGYQIQYSASSKFTSSKTVTVSGYGTTSKKISSLSKKKKYYVRIRTYKTVSGTKYYSGWSAAKTVTTK